MEKPKIRDSIRPKRAVKNQGKRNRTAGNNYERLLAKEFREVLGDLGCRTTRNSSRVLDACKVDLDSYFVNVQAKNVASSINYTALLRTIKDALLEGMPSRAELPIAVLHKRRGNELVIMNKDDFYKLLISHKQIVDGEK